jgi:DivIVA domain-containing protein
MGQPQRPEGKPESEDETKQLPSVSTETAEFIALDPSEDPVAEIASPSFRPAFRGYDRGSVDDYVRRVTEIIAELHASRSPRAAVKRALDRVGRETAGILQNARDTADEITLQSSKRAEERVTEAEREAARLRSEAEAARASAGRGDGRDLGGAPPDRREHEQARRAPAGHRLSGSGGLPGRQPERVQGPAEGSGEARGDGGGEARQPVTIVKLSERGVDRRPDAVAVMATV